jgi:hypothetical protein
MSVIRIRVSVCLDELTSHVQRPRQDFTYRSVGNQVGPAVVSESCVSRGQQYGDKAGGGLHL